jgi:LmbE family N-acetylglucosaminyl deacetylase
MAEATAQEPDEKDAVTLAAAEQEVVDAQSATPTAEESATKAHPKAVRQLSEEEMTRVMVIGAHPDDPEFGAGGTIAKLAAQGKEITYVLATSGDKGSHDPLVRPGQLATRREQEQRNAAAVLGVKEVIYLRYPDGILENTLALRARLAHLIRQHKPHILFAIDPWRHYQLAPDHRAAGYAALDALWAAREWHIFAEQLYGDEAPWRVSQAYLYWTDNADHFEDISDTIDKKIAALACHVSQVGTNTERLDERMRERGKAEGEALGMEYAEGFKLIKF